MRLINAEKLGELQHRRALVSIPRKDLKAGYGGRHHRDIGVGQRVEILLHPLNICRQAGKYYLAPIFFRHIVDIANVRVVEMIGADKELAEPTRACNINGILCNNYDIDQGEFFCRFNGKAHPLIAHRAEKHHFIFGKIIDACAVYNDGGRARYRQRAEMPLHGLRISARGEGEMPALGNKALNGEPIPLRELPELIIESAVDIGDNEPIRKRLFIGHNCFILLRKFVKYSGSGASRRILSRVVG